MIFYYSANGSLLQTNEENVYQGSNNANTIYFVAPLATTNRIMIAFSLPDGSSIAPEYMSFGNWLSGVFDGNGDNYSVWKYIIPAIITSISGTVSVQFYIVNGNSTTTTQTARINVSSGTSRTLPEIPSTTVYNTIVEKITEVENTINGLVVGTVQDTRVNQLISNNPMSKIYLMEESD